MKKTFTYICILFLLILLGSCNSNSTKQFSSLLKKKEYHCSSNNEDSFANLLINGVFINSELIDSFLAKNPQCDSINESGLYCYGKSSVDSRLDANILDSNIYFDNYLNINTRINEIRLKFPSAYANKYSSKFHGQNCDFIRIYDSQCNNIEIYFTDKKILAIFYQHDVD